MGSSFEQCCQVERSQFRQSESRLFFESDCSSPTRWEFQAPGSAPGSGPAPAPAPGSPVPMHLSLVRVSAGERSSSSSSKGEMGADGTRNSTGSSTGSHRSQDSGFSDSGGGGGGGGGVRKNRSQHLDHNHSQRNEGEGEVAVNHNKSHFLISPLVDIDPNLRSSILAENYFHERFLSSSQSRGGTENAQESHASYVQYKTRSPRSVRSYQYQYSDETDKECTNCIYQEIILARSSNGNGNGSAVSPLPADLSVGAPACCSTPKQSNLNTHKIRPSFMLKIDNFKSLDKNKILDNNNNSNVTQAQGDSRRSSISCDSGDRGFIRHLEKKPFPSPGLGPSVHTSGCSSSSGRSIRSLACIHENGSGSGPLNKSEIYTSRPSNFNPETAHLHPKWRTLPRGFKRVTVPDTSNEVIVVRTQADNASMRLWLHELRHQAEPECLNALQTKSLAWEPMGFSLSQDEQDTSFQQTLPSPTTMNMSALAVHSVSAPILSIRHVQEMASIISGEFSKICKHLEFGFFAQVPSLVECLSELMNEFLKHCHETFGNLQKFEKRLAISCYELRLAAKTLNDLISSSNHRDGLYSLSSTSNFNSSQNLYGIVGHTHEKQFHVIVAELVEEVVALGNIFGKVVDHRLTRDLSAILDTIENGGLPARVGLRSYVTVLGDGGLHICRLASSIRSVRGLLGVVLDATDDQDKVLALRCLATILCVGEAVKDFDRAGGFEIVADILYSPSCDPSIHFEAVSVLTQATDPWTDMEASLRNLGCHLEKIIVALTNVIIRSKTQDDLFLLTIAAIANLTFLETSSLHILGRYRAVTFIINAMREKPDCSIFIVDHVATVLANMAGIERYRADIVNSGGILALIYFLQQSPSNLRLAAEITACERVQQKSVIALSRLCNDESVIQVVVELNGMQRIIELCRHEKERNYSDGVLIACLATLRKLATFCSNQVVKGFHAEDLIQPRLLDSFLLYSSRQESYV